MATRPTFGALSQVKDPILQRVLKQLHDRINLLEGRAPAIGTLTQPLTVPLNAASQRIHSVANPSAPMDAVNVQAMQTYVDAAIAQAQAQAASSTTVTPVTVPPPVPGGPWPAPQAGTGLVRISGKDFVLAAGGAPWPWRGCTDFLLFKRYLDGESIAAVIANRVASGANLVRVLGMCYNITNFYPRNYANYFTQLGAFADVLLAAGLWLEFCVFADCQYSLLQMDTTALQIAHLSQVITALLPKTNVFLELVNEWPQNGVDPSKFAKPTGILSAAGSGLGGGDPFLPPWDYVPNHSPRDAQWMRKSKDAQDIRDGPFGNTTTYMTGVKRPVPSDEPMGAGDADVAGRRDSNPDNFYWFGAGSQMFGVGGTFHSDNGIQSVVFDATQQACANSFFQGMAAVPVAAQDWQYTRGPLADCPIQHSDALALRTYAKINGNTAICLVIQPQAGWVAIPVAPWTITGAVGPSGTLISLSKP